MPTKTASRRTPFADDPDQFDYVGDRARAAPAPPIPTQLHDPAGHHQVAGAGDAGRLRVRTDTPAPK